MFPRIAWGVLLLAILAAGYAFSREKKEAAAVELLLDADYSPQVLALIRGARKEVRVILYKAQGEERSHPRALLQALCEAKARGVDVQVLLDLDSAEPGKNRESQAFLKAGGVPVFLDAPDTTTHAKALVVDGETLVVGSANWTQGALKHNHEASVLVRSRELAARLVESFDRIRKEGGD